MDPRDKREDDEKGGTGVPHLRPSWPYTSRPDEPFAANALLIADIGHYLQAPEDEEIAANAAVIEKARELGVLRHAQQASVHQLLREYEILGEILESFVGLEAARLVRDSLRLTPEQVTALGEPATLIVWGEHIGLVGNNGSGKSTLISLVMT